MIIPVAITTVLSFAISSCKKEVANTSLQNDVISVAKTKAIKQEQVKKVHVSNLAELYAAVNDVNNAGNLIEMAPGTYTLNATYPNSGRLEFQKDMQLQGQEGHSERVIIDESLLPAASFLTGTTRTGGIRMGRGANVLAWVTLKGGTLAANAFSAIDTDLNSAETQIGILHVTVLGNGGSIGIDIRNRRVDQAGRIIEAFLEDNDISGVVTFLGPAIEIQNANNASGSKITVDLKNNYLHDNRVGVGAFNNASNSTVLNSRIDVASHADRIERNGIGMYLGGGLAQLSTIQSNGNATHVEMHGSSITNNNPQPLPPALQPGVGGVVPCGIHAFGGASSTGGASGNLLTIKLWGCKVSENNGTDIYAFGAHSVSATPAGINNRLEIELNGVSKKASVQATPSFPTEPAGTNTVNVIR